MTEGRAANARRVLVAQSYFLHFDSKLSEAAQPIPPLGSLICAAVLRERGHEVHFFDSMMARAEDEIGAAMDRVKPDVLVIFEDSFNYLTKMCLGRMREAAARMITLARDRSIDVIVAGSDASDDPTFFLKVGAAAVAKGEGEFAVAEWLEQPDRGESIPGIVTLRSDGSITTGPARAPVRDLDLLPSPAWSLLDVAAYRDIWMSRHGHFSLPMATSRGCPFHCNWCAKPIWGQRYAAMSPVRAAREMRDLKALGATHANVLDDILGLKPGWLDAFAEEVVAGGGLPFKCLSRADLLTDASVAALARAGCRRVWIGAESGSQSILDAMEKGTTVGEIRAAARRLRAAGIEVGFFLQFGYPGETEADVRATVGLVTTEPPDDIGISVSYPLPGTRFHERVKSEMTGATHWRDSSDLAVLFEARRDTAYYRRLHSYVHARFRLSRALRGGRGLLRVSRVIRYAFGSLIHGAALRLFGMDRKTTRHLAPELSRQNAATPAATGS